MGADADDPEQAWWAESESFRTNVYQGDFEVANAAELPVELLHHVFAAENDPDFEDAFGEWLSYLLEDEDHPCVTLGVEQCCKQGVLLTEDLRATRIKDMPFEDRARLSYFLARCPRHVLVHVSHYIYWLVRSERGRRRRSPDWVVAGAELVHRPT